PRSGIAEPCRFRGAEEHEPPVRLHAVGLEVAVGPSVSLVKKDRRRLAALGGQLIGDVTQIEMTEDAIELRHIDVGPRGCRRGSAACSRRSATESRGRSSPSRGGPFTSASPSMTVASIWILLTTVGVLSRLDPMDGKSSPA